MLEDFLGYRQTMSVYTVIHSTTNYILCLKIYVITNYTPHIKKHYNLYSCNVVRWCYIEFGFSEYSLPKQYANVLRDVFLIICIGLIQIKAAWILNVTIINKLHKFFDDNRMLWVLKSDVTLYIIIVTP